MDVEETLKTLEKIKFSLQFIMLSQADAMYVVDTLIEVVKQIKR